MTDSGQAVDSDSIWDRLRVHRERLQSGSTLQPDGHEIAERMARRAESLRAQPADTNRESDRFEILAFSKMNERYGIPLDMIISVEALEHFTTVPGVPDFVRGVTPWRGSILSLIDLGRFFGKRDTVLADLKAYLVVENCGRRVAFVTHNVEGIISISASDIFKNPDLPVDISPDWISGVHDENRLILNTSEIIDSIKEHCSTTD